MTIPDSTAKSTPHRAGRGGAAQAWRRPSRLLLDLIKPERADILIILTFSIMSGVLNLATPLAVDSVVNNIAFGGQELVYVQALLILAFALFLFLALQAVLRGAQHYVMEIIQRRLFLRMTADLAYRLPRVQAAVLEEASGPDLVNRFFEIVTVQKSSSLLLLQGINIVLSALIGLVVLGFYHPFLLAFDMVLIASLVLVLYFMGQGAVSSSIRESYAKHAVATWLEQMALFPVFFKGDGGAALAMERADLLGREYLHARREHYRVLIRQIAGLLTLQAAASAALLTIGGALVLRGELTLGQLVASELIVGAIVSSVAKFDKQLESWYDVLAAADKLRHLTGLSIEREGGELPRDSSGPASLELREVAYGYDPDHVLFNDISLHARPGARVAVVSAAGYGASALLNLAYATHNPGRGMVLLDGLDVRHWDLEALRRQVALVRGTEIVEGTIAQNVRLGRENLGMDAVQRALEDVGLARDVLGFESGMDTQLKVGGRPLSRAQRTRLVLARAIIGCPRLLLVDEALEGLDIETVSELESCLFDRSNPWTLVLVTRDPDLVARCDDVIRLGECHLSQGRVPPGSGPA